jgi:hypothetical protein
MGAGSFAGPFYAQKSTATYLETDGAGASWSANIPVNKNSPSYWDNGAITTPTDPQTLTDIATGLLRSNFLAPLSIDLAGGTLAFQSSGDGGITSSGSFTDPGVQWSLSGTQVVEANSTYSAPNGGTGLEFRYRTDGGNNFGEIIAISRFGLFPVQPIQISASTLTLNEPTTVLAGNCIIGSAGDGFQNYYKTLAASGVAVPGFVTLTGTTATQTLTLPSPAPAGLEIVIKNQSSQSWTVSSASGAQIVPTGDIPAATATISISSGSLIRLWSDGTFWNQQ